MTTTELDPREVRALTFLVHQECARAQKHWNPKGIEGQIRLAIEEDRRTPGQVLTAAYAAVRDDTARTPAAIRWAERYPFEPGSTAPEAPRCYVCAKPERACREAAAKAGDPHTFTIYPEPEPEHTVPWRSLAHSIDDDSPDAP